MPQSYTFNNIIMVPCYSLPFRCTLCYMSESTIVKAQPKKTILRITLVSLFAALIAGGSFVKIPLPFSPIPIVMQNLFTVLSGLVLGPVLGSAAVALYLFAGALGLPVFSGVGGGIARFASPTGGYLIGYCLAALSAGLVAGQPNKDASLFRIVLAATLGFLIVYIPGLLWLYRFMESWPKTFTGGFFPFLIGDVIKIALAAPAAKRLRKTAANQLYE